MEYVCGFLRLTGVATDHRDRVLLLRKLKPDWQKGLLNGVGGKVGDRIDETPDFAMAREWAEETCGNAKEMDWKRFARLTFVSGDVVYFYKAVANSLDLFDIHGRKNDAGERFEALPLEHALRRDDLIPNLKWLLPLAFLDTCDQVVEVSEVERGIP